jgi:hypothetical protein
MKPTSVDDIYSQLLDMAEQIRRLENARRSLVDMGDTTVFRSGTVAANGDVIRGTGFTVSRSGAGDYTVTFASGVFPGAPSVTATAQSSSSVTARVFPTPTSTSWRIVTFSVGSSPAPVDAVFHWEASY